MTPLWESRPNAVKAPGTYYSSRKAHLCGVGRNQARPMFGASNLNIATNALAGGRCLEDLERLRNNEVYMDALGSQRIPALVQVRGEARGVAS